MPLVSRARTVDSLMDAPTHGGETKRCFVMTEVAIHTIALPEGHFTALVHSRPGAEMGVIAILDHDEVEAQIALLRNAVEDAKRLDAGLPAVNAAPSLRRQ